MKLLKSNLNQQFSKPFQGKKIIINSPYKQSATYLNSNSIVLWIFLRNMSDNQAPLFNHPSIWGTGWWIKFQARTTVRPCVQGMVGTDTQVKMTVPNGPHDSELLCKKTLRKKSILVTESSPFSSGQNQQLIRSHIPKNYFLESQHDFRFPYRKWILPQIPMVSGMYEEVTSGF